MVRVSLGPWRREKQRGRSLRGKEEEKDRQS